MNRKAPRCTHVTEVPWTGHASALMRRRCHRLTKHDSGLCHVHRTQWPDWMGSHRKKPAALQALAGLADPDPDPPTVETGHVPQPD